MGGFIMCEYNEGFPMFTYSVKGSCNLTTHLSISHDMTGPFSVKTQRNNPAIDNWGAIPEGSLRDLTNQPCM